MTTVQAPFDISSHELGPMENFIYLIHDTASNRMAVVDPAWDAEEILRQVEQRQSKITDILLTHSHHDHINAIEDILKVYDAQVHLLKPEAQFWGRYLDLPTLHHGGDTIRLGETDINVLHTPGHTPGSACYQVHDQLITGDTMFVFGCGRCDLAGGDPHQMYATLNRLKTNLPGNTIILPGHNYADRTTSTMQDEIKGNPFLHCDSEDEFVHYRMHEHDRVRNSPYHPVLKK